MRRVNKAKMSLHNHRLTLVAIAWRNLYTRPGRTLLTLVGIALGVAAVLATGITNRNVTSTLDGLFKRTLGSAELQVTPLGTKTTVKEAVLEAVRRTPGVRLAVPIIRTSTVLPGNLSAGQLVFNSSGKLEIGKSFEIQGIDTELEPEMRVYTLVAGRFPELGEYQALVPQTFAEQNNLTLGGDLTLFGPSGTESLEITGLLADSGVAMINSGNVVFAPIDIVKEIFSLEHGYSEINIQANTGTGDDPQALAELKAALEGNLGQAGRVSYPAGRADLVPRMASAYQFTLSFFSIVALFMGAFLIYNTFATTVLERTQEIGMLRAIGMTRRQVMGQVMLEAGFLSLLGCLLGLAAGVFLANGLMALMRGFFQVEANSLSFTVADLVKSTSVGLLGTFLAILLPARQAARTTPVEALAARSRSDQKVKPAVWKAGFVLLGAGLVFLNQPDNGAIQWLLAVRMGALIQFLMGAVLTVPLAVTALEPITRWLSARLYGGMGSLGAQNVRRTVIRTMVTVASLSISLIMIIEVDSLVYVLKQDVSDWLDNALGADLLVRAPHPMQQSFARELESIPGVQASSPSRVIRVKVADDSLDRTKQQNDTLFFVAIDPDQFRRVGGKEFITSQGDPEAAWARLSQGNALFISSVVADEYGLKQGDRLTLLIQRGQQEFRVAGLTTEFDQDGLIVTGTYPDLRRMFGENRADLFTIKAAPGYDAEEVARVIKSRYEKREGIQVQTTKIFKEGVMVFYNRLTSLFNVLGLVGVIIGTIGLLNTMTMNVLERRRELGALRALGSLRRQVVRMVLAEALIIGIVSALYGILFGFVLSHVLVTAANLISGYDLQYVFSTRPYLLSLLIALLISQLATLAPARRAARVNIIQALKHE
jgi:putative ABC transport system permease protein